MLVKPKPCRQCKTPTTNRVGLRIICGIDCAVLYGKSEALRKQLKAKAEVRKSERKEHRAAKEKIKTLVQVCAEARVVIQRYARLRDLAAGYTTCICCGDGPIEHGCHFFAVGSKYRAARLSLDPRQIFGGCIRCNVFVGGGNQRGFEAGLIARYGQSILAELSELKRKADSGEDAPLTKEEVRLIKSEYQAKCRELVKGQ